MDTNWLQRSRNSGSPMPPRKRAVKAVPRRLPPVTAARRTPQKLRFPAAPQRRSKDGGARHLAAVRSRAASARQHARPEPCSSCSVDGRVGSCCFLYAHLVLVLAPDQNSVK
ncbi:hypothetical protein EJB05_55481 [Eragrostis curvula]|uniref:Uncharacterized protein n=1 Tax=Eragrostis curvula TaxID=38414 RepID=A0A5J9SJM0_9POAL|nr:hypothetical protein EJB05_55481 [Eragrostis curvula]